MLSSRAEGHALPEDGFLQRVYPEEIVYAKSYENGKHFRVALSSLYTAVWTTKSRHA